MNGTHIGTAISDSGGLSAAQETYAGQGGGTQAHLQNQGVVPFTGFDALLLAGVASLLLLGGAALALLRGPRAERESAPSRPRA